jgi:LacI family transcriptional regulator/LacI family repressor for deo operon, udp, cdd, tsx, nupC, and nupG
VAGVHRAYSSSNLVFGPDDIIQAGAHFEDGHRCGHALFQSRSESDRPTAVTCYNDLVAMGLCKALSELGIRCPEEVSVVGFDDIKFCEYLMVPLTTIRVPKFEMGNLAAQMLIRHIESKQAVTPRKVYLDATLVVRSSTAPPAHSPIAVGAANGDGARKPHRRSVKTHPAAVSGTHSSPESGGTLE